MHQRYADQRQQEAACGLVGALQAAFDCPQQAAQYQGGADNAHFRQQVQKRIVAVREQHVVFIRTEAVRVHVFQKAVQRIAAPAVAQPRCLQENLPCFAPFVTASRAFQLRTVHAFHRTLQ